MSMHTEYLQYALFDLDNYFQTQKVMDGMVNELVGNDPAWFALGQTTSIRVHQFRNTLDARHQTEIAISEEKDQCGHFARR